MRKPVQALIMVLQVSITFSAIAQSPGTANERLSKSIKPSLVAISVANIDETVKWYQDNLGFAVKEKKDFPQHSLRIAFLALNDFEIELVEDKKSVSLVAIQKHLPEADDETKIQGFVKLAFTVEDVEALASRLKSKGVRFQMEMTKSNRKEGVKFFIVRDNNGNWLQFSGKSK
jgi:catechol 2,3-dioxygenase-like lactoylglutathione lyase family enzyme